MGSTVQWCWISAGSITGLATSSAVLRAAAVSSVAGPVTIDNLLVADIVFESSVFFAIAMIGVHASHHLVVVDRSIHPTVPVVPITGPTATGEGCGSIAASCFPSAIFRSVAMVTIYSGENFVAWAFVVYNIIHTVQVIGP